MPDPLTIWSNVDLCPELHDRLVREIAPHKLVPASAKTANNLAGSMFDANLDQADIAFGQPDPDQIATLPRIRWIQLTTAGYTRYDTPAFREMAKKKLIALCNASSVYSEPCAQHTLSMMLALARRLPQSIDNLRGPHAWPYLPLRAQSVLLNGQTVLLVGYGAIARRLAELLAPFAMKVIGFRRNPSANEMNARIVSISELDAWLPKADHVINILPASAETDGFFNAKRFAKLKSTAIYYNIGRGSTNDEAALEAALRAKQFAAAYIDAFLIEPLPPEHSLWTAPNCFITPHTAGGHANEYERHVELFVENLKRFQAGQPLIDRIM